MKILVLGITITLLIVLSGCSDDSGQTSRENVSNYGQYDKGTPMCDKGAYGDENGLCN